MMRKRIGSLILCFAIILFTLPKNMSVIQANAAVEALWPLPKQYTYISSNFYAQRGSSTHKAIDIPAPEGTDIYAVLDGEVIFSGVLADSKDSCGNTVILYHSSIGKYTVYCHASSLCVSKGQSVSQGTVIAKVGNTGDSSGNHLDFKLCTGYQTTGVPWPRGHQDPMSFFSWKYDIIPPKKWYETVTLANLGDSFDALILNKAAGIPIRTISSCTVTVKKPTISLSKSSHSMWIGDTVTLTGSTNPGNQSISWDSSNTGVATVSGGKITGVGEGTATITGTITVNGKNYLATCSITIKKPYLTLSSESGSSKDDHVYYSTGGFYAGIFNLPTAICTPSGSVSWSIASGNASTNNGKLMINQPGTVVARATFTYQGKNYSADYTYTRTVTFSAGSAFTLRSGPSTSTSSLVSIPKGTSLTVASLDYSDGTYVWGKVTYSGKTGYVALWRKDRSESNGIITV